MNYNYDVIWMISKTYSVTEGFHPTSEVVYKKNLPKNAMKK